MPARLRRTEALPPRPHFSLPWMSRLSPPPSQASFRRKRRFIQPVLAEHLGCSPPRAAAASSPAPALMDAQAREAAPSKGAHSSELAAWLREAGGRDAELHRAWRGGWGPGPGALPSRGPGLAKPAHRCRPGLRAPALRAFHRNRRERAQVTEPGCSQGNGGTGTSGPWKLEKQARKTKVCGDSRFVLCEEAGGRKQVEKRVLNYEYSS